MNYSFDIRVLNYLIYNNLRKLTIKLKYLKEFDKV